MTCVLLVEDSATVRFLLTAAFEGRGFTVHGVTDAAQVIATAQRVRPDVVVLNKMLPGRDGDSVITELRASSTLAHTKIMMLTDSKRRQDVMASIQRGADDYVVKPFDAEDVAHRVERLAGIASV